MLTSVPGRIRSIRHPRISPNKSSIPISKGTYVAVHLWILVQAALAKGQWSKQSSSLQQRLQPFHTKVYGRAEPQCARVCKAHRVGGFERRNDRVSHQGHGRPGDRTGAACGERRFEGSGSFGMAAWETCMVCGGGELAPEVDAAPPSKDSIRQAMKVLYNAPVAVRKETSMLKDVPKKTAVARAMITGAAKPLFFSFRFVLGVCHITTGTGMRPHSTS